ncbi:Cystine-binding periplasmic protein precursor [Pelagimonas phthalicica]|uniref:Cystine-binding periplasmic protein n=1 Tax=Pelagimonas phthalicica TaxID=1037362 RepID=A0A238JGK2_9RHOB|nr:transporter substrate-binding domain-containing protein [Pelagimonas phthalicica]TDS92263.1 amino acid ABC transporter substrate-binding protein (PAAT family) [Pelagimonas phthalicica]SMX29324.1 Cystine-binding periplasmic protein precursor [Pelagimonas phthalicica]
MASSFAKFWKAAAQVLPLILAGHAAQAESWNVGSQDAFEPFNYTKDGIYMGIDVQILNEAANMVGVTLKHHPSPWKRALLDFEAGHLDAVFQITPTAERFKKWNMVGPFRKTRTVFLTKTDSPFQDIQSVDDLDGHVVGVVAGFTYESRFDSHPGITREASKDDYTNVRKLLLGRAEIVVGGYATLAHVVRELNATDELRFLPTALIEQDRYIVFRRGEVGDSQAQRMQEALEQMQASGRIQDIIQSHLVRE